MGRSRHSPRPAAALRGRFGRRLFLLFLGCASVPLPVFAWSASHLLADELRKDCEARLHDSVKSAGMNLAARLLQLRDDLDAACAELRHGGVRGLDGAPETMRQRLQDQFRCLAVHAGGRVVPVVGTAPAWLQAIDAQAQEHLAAGRPLLQRGPAATPDGTWPMSLLRRLDPGLAASPLGGAGGQAAGVWC